MLPNHASEAWVSLPSEEQLRSTAGRQPHPYETFMGGTIARMSRLMMAHDVIGPVFAQLSRTLLFGPGTMSRAEREMVASVAAAAQACHY